MGKTDLGKWMITNGGEYSADATYEQLTMVKYGNSTYITLKTVTGITPTDDKINYQLMAQGFDATALSAVQAEDTQGLCGEKGEIVTAQSLVDALADKVMNTVMAKVGTAALTGGMTDLSSGVNSLYSNLDALNTGILAGAIIFPKLEGTGNQKVNVKFGKTLPQKPIIIVSWCDTQHVDTYCSGLTVCERSTTGFTVSMNRITANSSAWYASWIAVIR